MWFNIRYHRMGIRVKSTCDEMRGSVRAGSERRNARVKQAAGLLKPWEETLKQGDIPGAYWAALTHPAATIVTRIFADVHMLSHLVGADDCNNWRRTTRCSRQRWSASNANRTKVLS